jgi:hypothetical protein
MTEEEAREVLRLGSRDGLEGWIAVQLWIPRPSGGWSVASTRDGWSFTLEPVEGAMRIAAFPPGPRPRPAVWVVGAM